MATANLTITYYSTRLFLFYIQILMFVLKTLSSLLQRRKSNTVTDAQLLSIIYLCYSSINSTLQINGITSLTFLVLYHSVMIFEIKTKLCNTPLNYIVCYHNDKPSQKKNLICVYIL